METPVNQKIGMRIRNIRKTQGLTQEQLAESVSLSPSYISRVETGNSTPSLECLCKIASALDVGLQAILYDLFLTDTTGGTAQEIAVTVSCLPPRVQKLALEYIKSLASCLAEP